jgi:hypothetical protein
MIISNLKRKHYYSSENAESLDNRKHSDGKIAGKIKWELSDSFHLRLLIHYVGDIHQPLHTSSRFTSDFPDGDMGGNSFIVDLGD